MAPQEQLPSNLMTHSYSGISIRSCNFSMHFKWETEALFNNRVAGIFIRVDSQEGALERLEEVVKWGV